MGDAESTPAPEVKLEDRVIAIVDSRDSGGAAAALRQRGWDVDILTKESDAERLEPKKGGLSGALSKAAALFGDEMRIIDQIERTLSEGNQVLVVGADPERSSEAARILDQHGALSMWDFGSWTFVAVGSTDEGEEETG